MDDKHSLWIDCDRTVFRNCSVCEERYFAKEQGFCYKYRVVNDQGTDTLEECLYYCNNCLADGADTQARAANRLKEKLIAQWHKERNLIERPWRFDRSDKMWREN